MAEVIGRSKELASLRETWSRVQAGEGAMVLLSGTAGIGKTTIVAAFLESLGETALVMSATCAPGDPDLEPIRVALTEGGLDRRLALRPPRALSLFLIDESGMLIARAEHHEFEIDPDLFAGMLSAVGNFVRDSLALLGTRDDTGLNTLGYRGYRILLEAGSHQTLVAIVEGQEDAAFLTAMQGWLEAIMADHAGTLESWDGDEAKVEGVVALLEGFLDETPSSGRPERLFDTILLGMRRATAERPGVMVIEDLHHAASATLGLIHYLARNLVGLPLLILGSYRPEATLPGQRDVPVLRDSLQLLGREQLAREISVGPIEDADLARILADRFPHLDTGPVLGWAGGNPWFAIELALDEPTDPPPIPAPIQAYLEDQLAGVEALEVLIEAALVGETFSSRELADSLERKPIPLMKLLARIERNHQVIAAKGKEYIFPMRLMWHYLALRG